MRMLVCMLFVLFAVSPAWAERPLRIVSLDSCADQFVLGLADRAQIAAVSRRADDDDSYFRARAAGLRMTRGTLEETLALRPDLVARNWGGGWDAARTYARFDVPVLQVGDAQDFDAARAELIAASEAFGQGARGAAIARDLDARLARLRTQAPQQAPDVIYLTAGGVVAGEGVMLDAIIRAAGARNASEAGPGWTMLPLESMVRRPPAFLALGFFDAELTRSSAWTRSRHPVLQRLAHDARAVHLPARTIVCPGWFSVEAAETLARALRAETAQ